MPLIEQVINENNWCAELTLGKSEPFRLNNQQAYIFKDTPCGPFGSTVIYALNHNLVYLIRIETSKSYRDVEFQVKPILDTFRFIQ